MLQLVSLSISKCMYRKQANKKSPDLVTYSVIWFEQLEPIIEVSTINGCINPTDH
jgi:hypothetical protein